MLSNEPHTRTLVPQIQRSYLTHTCMLLSTFCIMFELSTSDTESYFFWYAT